MWYLTTKRWINLAQDLSRFCQWERMRTSWKVWDPKQNLLDLIPRSAIWIPDYVFIVLNSRSQVIIAMTWLCRHELKSHSWVGLKNDPVQLLYSVQECLDQVWMISMIDKMSNDLSRQLLILLQDNANCQNVILKCALYGFPPTGHWTNRHIQNKARPPPWCGWFSRFAD